MTAKPGTPTRPLKGDQILPYFVVNNLPRPLPGLLIAAILGATMAVVSAAINSLATTALMGFRRQSSSQPTVLMAKLLTVAFGVVATLLALFVLAKFGSIIKATNVIMAASGRPTAWPVPAWRILAAREQPGGDLGNGVRTGGGPGRVLRKADLPSAG